MHLQIVLAFALLLWWPERTPPYAVVTGVPGAVLWVCGRLVLILVIGAVVSQSARVRLRGEDANPQRALTFYHRVLLLLRFLLLAGVAGDLFLTSWPQILERQDTLRAVPGLPQLVAVAPYLLGLTALWWIVFPVEQAARGPGGSAPGRSRGRFVIFNLRHQVAVVALPLTVIVVTYATTEQYRERLVGRLHTPWGPEIVLGAVAITLFLLAPVMLRRVWATSPLPDGALRRRLLELCDRIGLRVREILVWHSDGMVVNAAVMGLFPRVRYILLSDALLESMTDEEIEAVFGHEAGHVRHHHIPYFLLFALLSMMICSGVMEILIRLGQGANPVWRLSTDTIQLIGLVAVAPVWGFAFGWISRRFERQADLFGARCAAPASGEVNCQAACAVHDPAVRSPEVQPYSVCAGGANIFVRALRKVALLNGIPPEERSWRHSSIASRMRFLTALSGDPRLTHRFLQTIRTIKLSLVALNVVALAIAAVYIWQTPVYRKAVMTSLVEPMRRIFE